MANKNLRPAGGGSPTPVDIGHGDQPEATKKQPSFRGVNAWMKSRDTVLYRSMNANAQVMSEDQE